MDSSFLEKMMYGSQELAFKNLCFVQKLFFVAQIYFLLFNIGFDFEFSISKQVQMH